MLFLDTHDVSIGNKGTCAESRLSRALTRSSTCTDGSLFSDARCTAIAQCGTIGSAWLSFKTVAVRWTAVIEAACCAAEGIAKMASEAADEAEAQACKDTTFEWRTLAPKAAEGGASMIYG